MAENFVVNPANRTGSAIDILNQAGDVDRTNPKHHMLAGTAKVEITCREEGAAAYRISEKTMPHIPRELWDKKIAIHDPLYLRALVLDDDGSRHALITMDTTAIGARTITQEILGDSADDFMPRLRARLEREAGIAPQAVTVAASHTHPPGRLLCDDDAQLDKAVEAVTRAVANLAEVRVGAGSARQDRLTYNRTLMMKDGSDYSLRSCNPYPPDAEVERLRPVDPEVGVLRVDRMDGTPLAVVYNFACHLLNGVPSTDITADFPAVTSEFVESTLGHDCLAMFLQGGGGDVCEVNQLDRDLPKWGPEFGLLLGASVLEARRSARPAAATIQSGSRNLEFPLRRDIPAVVAELRREQTELAASLRYTSLNFKTFLPLYLKHRLSPDFPLHSAHRYLHASGRDDSGFATLGERNERLLDKYLSSIHAMERMARNEEKIATLLRHQEIIDELGVPALPAEVQGIRIGDWVLLTAPMEVLSETALRIKAESPHPRTFIASLANGYLHYAPPASYYPRGGYEVTECLLAPDWENRFHSAANELLAELSTTS